MIASQKLLLPWGPLSAAFLLSGLILTGPSDMVFAATQAEQDLGYGINAVRRGDFMEGVKSLEKAKGGVVDDYRRFFLGEGLFYLGRFDDAAGHFAAVVKMRGSRMQGRAGWRLADVRWHQGQRREAAALYTKAMKTDPRDGDAAVALLRMGDAALPPQWPQDVATGRAASRKAQATAQGFYRDVQTRHPGHPLVVAATERLCALEECPTEVSPALANLGAQAAQQDPDEDTGLAESDGEDSGDEPVAPTEEISVRPDEGPSTPGMALSAEARLARAEILLKQRQWGAAAKEIETMTAGWPDSLAAERDLLLGKIKYRSRKDYVGASKLLLRASKNLPNDKAAWAAFHGARALSRADQDEQAIAKYREMVSRFPTSSWVAEARFLAGWLHFNLGHFRKALPDLRLVVNEHPRSAFSADGAWYLALCWHFLGQHEAALGALKVFEKRAHLRPHLRPRERVLYWRGRFLHALGKTQEAAEAWREGVRDEPFAWYGLLAAQRLKAMAQDDPLSLSGYAESLPPLRRQDKGHPIAKKVNALVAAGLLDDAGIELDRGTSAILRALGRSHGFALVLDLARASGGYVKAHSLASSLGAKYLQHAPAGDTAKVWKAAYPLPYAELVDSYGPPAGNPPHLLHAIMRKESGFDSRVVSYADARGLLQMIPPTSKRVAREMGVDYFAETLFEPDYNVQLGATYIGALYDKFKNQVALTAGAFNGGPRAMKRWCDRFGDHEIDAFVELVSYSQSREYIKRVTHNYARYRYLYAQGRYLPNLHVDCAYRAEGPNY